MNIKNKQQWVLLGLGVLVAFAVAGNVAWQHRRGEQSRNVGLLLVKIEQKVNELQSLHWQAIAQGTVDEEFLERMRAARLDLLETGKTLKQSTNGRKELDSFFASYTAYVTSIDQELLFVALKKRTTSPGWNGKPSAQVTKNSRRRLARRRINSASAP
jgi:hypothetical protein